jgi:hypothetical protein
MQGGLMTRRDSLSDEILIDALGSGMTQADAARDAGVSERTARRRLEDPEYRAVLEAQQFDARRVCFDTRQSLFTKAVRRLEEILDDPDLSPSILLQAIKIALSTGFKAHELETDERLRRLEEHYEPLSRPEITW